MPLYCFHCSACKLSFDELCHWSERDAVVCPKCNSVPEQKVTAPASIMFTNPKGTSKEDNFDYVAKTNYENAVKMREVAESQNKHNFKYKDYSSDIEKYEGKIADIDPFIK